MTCKTYQSNSVETLSVKLLETLENHGVDLSAFILYDYINVEALADLVHDDTKSPVMVMFELDDQLVTIKGGDTVTIEIEEETLP